MKQPGSAFLIITALVIASVLTSVWWIDAIIKVNAVEMQGELDNFDRLRSIAVFKSGLAGENNAIPDEEQKQLFLQGETTAITEAELLARLKSLATTEGLEVLRASAVPPRTEVPLLVVGGSLEIFGTTAAVYRFVQQIESTKPLLFVDRLTLRSNNVSGSETTTETMLSAEIVVSGFSQPINGIAEVTVQP